MQRKPWNAGLHAAENGYSFDPWHDTGRMSGTLVFQATVSFTLRA
jgi:hypothetical protein